MRPHYEESEYFHDRAYRVHAHVGIAWRCLGFETEPDEDTVWTGTEERTGRVVCYMVGDDSLFCFYPEDLEEISRREFCGVCGQIGCHHDGYEED